MMALLLIASSGAKITLLSGVINTVENLNFLYYTVPYRSH